MKKRAAVPCAALTLLTVFAQGCASPSPEDPASSPEVSAKTLELIGGVPANSPSLNAIGTLGFKATYKDCYTGETVTIFDPFCTGSLVSNRTVVTAKHCVDVVRYYGSEQMVPAFGIGPDGRNPSRVVEIVDLQRAPLDAGGFVGYGHDVGTVHLNEAVTDVTPIKFATLNASAVGKDFAAIGYGIQDNAGTSGTRMAGTVKLNALEGRIFELMFGSFEAFKAWITGSGFGQLGLDHEGGEGGADGGVIAGDGGPIDPGGEDGGSYEDAYEQLLRDIYENTHLLPGYEAYVGNREGNAQLCFGDSGGPLIRANNKGELVAYGVTSGGVGSGQLICDYGAVYAAFGADVTTFLKAAKAWKDPCKGISSDGICKGKVAQRCTTSDEGVRRLTSTNCGLLGQTCAVASSGEAMCTAPGEEPIALDKHVWDECDYFGGADGGSTGGGSSGNEDDFASAPGALSDLLNQIHTQNRSTYVGPLGRAR